MIVFSEKDEKVLRVFCAVEQAKHSFFRAMLDCAKENKLEPLEVMKHGVDMLQAAILFEDLDEMTGGNENERIDSTV